jgi:hypothetical protein
LVEFFGTDRISLDNIDEVLWPVAVKLELDG